MRVTTNFDRGEAHKFSLADKSLSQVVVVSLAHNFLSPTTCNSRVEPDESDDQLVTTDHVTPSAARRGKISPARSLRSKSGPQLSVTDNLQLAS
jgi:hypothetical protein